MFKLIDETIIKFLKKIWQPLSKISLFIVFFYFGFLKVLGLSPATPLVEALFQKTLNFFPFSYFIIFFGLFEMLIGLAFIIPHLERLAIFLLIIHMITTFMPLILLPQISWQKFLVPTLEGQYIIKNLVIISLAFVIGAHLRIFKS
ncbi:MAG: hypothetical protein KatS3mg094_450 [Candidatus Parcubacteria bacterium]|nr:MAG: hypothetical protein KatS3mg094_450 [Candidatus Parcubacteria bacterium]